MVKVAVALPEFVEPHALGPSTRLTPPNCHCTLGAGAPVTTVLMVTVAPTLVAWSPGPVILGGRSTEMTPWGPNCDVFQVRLPVKDVRLVTAKSPDLVP